MVLEPIRGVNKDQSRLKSLYFLLQSTAKLLPINNAERALLNKAMPFLTIQGSEENWIISFSESRNASTIVPKANFNFYKHSDDIEIARNNKIEATKLLIILFPELHLRSIISKDQVFRNTLWASIAKKTIPNLLLILLLVPFSDSIIFRISALSIIPIIFFRIESVKSQILLVGNAFLIANTFFESVHLYQIFCLIFFICYNIALESSIFATNIKAYYWVLGQIIIVASIVIKENILPEITFIILLAALVTNFIFNVGATMGDRLVFHSSLGFCMLLGYAIYWVAQKVNKPNFSILLVLPILALYSFKTIDRNNAWKNDITLALTDVKINPNSIALNGNASSRNLDLSDLPINKGNEKKFIQKSIFYGNKALQLHPEFVNGHLNIGLAFAKNNQYDSAKVHWDIAFKIYPSHPQKELYYNLLADTYYTQGYNFGAKQQWAEGKSYLQKAVECNPNNAKYWYDLGGFSYNSQDYVTAKKAWTKAFQLNPTDPNIQKVQGVLK